MNWSYCLTNSIYSTYDRTVLVLGLSQPRVSRDLAILRAANLVRTRRQGNRVRYSLSRAPFLNYPLRKFLSEMVPFFPELQADVQNLQELKGSGMTESSTGCVKEQQ